jgi:hypothetical protein
LAAGAASKLLGSAFAEVVLGLDLENRLEKGLADATEVGAAGVAHSGVSVFSGYAADGTEIASALAEFSGSTSMTRGAGGRVFVSRFVTRNPPKAPAPDARTDGVVEEAAGGTVDTAVGVTSSTSWISKPAAGGAVKSRFTTAGFSFLGVVNRPKPASGTISTPFASDCFFLKNT